MTDYTLFVDESGQSGINKIGYDGSSGASEYMTMGAVLVPNVLHGHLRESLAEITKRIGKSDLHCSRMNHNQIVYFCQQLAKEKLLAFGVISNKRTLGSYSRVISHSDKRYYNKCAQYLLEKVGQFMEQNGIGEDNLTVLFEEGNFNYSELRGLIAACRENPLYPVTKNLRNVNPASINCRPKEEEPILQAADLVAHSLFRCVNKTKQNLSILEPRYIQELRSLFFADKESNNISGFGIKGVHSLENIKLEADIFQFLKTLKTK